MNCGSEVKKDTVDEIADAILALDPETRVQVVFPLQAAAAAQRRKQPKRVCATRKAEEERCGGHRLDRTAEDSAV